MGSGSSFPPVVGDHHEFAVRLLGGFQLYVGGEPLEALRSGRARSLLGLLILHADVAHARQRLAFEFWPDSPEAQARTNLRNLLHTLRQVHPAVDASLHVTPTTLQWRPTKSTRLDVDCFVEAVQAAMTVDPDDPDELIARCREADELYGGELLAGDDDEWLLGPREALRDRYRTTLRLLASALVDDGRATEATAVARDLVNADPLDESAHRLRMEAHHAAGDRAGAVRAYHECVATLERDLGVEPGPATVAMYAALLETPDEPAERRQPAVRARPGLVGRDAEWQRLVAAWHAVEHGPPAAVLVTGEPGVGKSRLVEELRAWCARSGARIGEARSYATEGDLGYGVVAAWLRSPDIQGGLAQLAHGERAELARLLPELGSPPASEWSDDALRRRRIFDAAASAVAGSAQPTLLVADDAQWSDQVSQELVHYLVRRRVEAPLLVVLTARREELDAGHPLTALRDALAALERLTELPLARLSREATGALGSQLTGSQLDDGAIDALFAETEGNPLFVVETVRAGGDGSTDSAGMSPRLRAVIDGRFHRLSEVASTVLGGAAVVARPCSAALLSRICDLDDRSLARGLDELWRRGILLETGSDSYELSHGKLRDAAYDGLSPAIRRALHLAAAESLVELAGQDPDLASGQVAAHFEAANRPVEAVTWLQRAALEAEGVAAYAEAVRLLERALALVPDLPADTRHGRELELLSSMPPAIAGAEGYVASRMRHTHRRAADVATTLGVDLEPAVLRSMVMSALCRDEFDGAAEAAGHLLSVATGRGDASLRLEAEYLLGIAAFWAARLDEARLHFETVVAEFDRSTSADHQQTYGHDAQVVCLSRLANTLWFLGRPDDARRTCDDALRLAAEVGHALSDGTAAVFACMLAIDLGDNELLRQVEPRVAALANDSLPFAIKHEAFRGLIDVLDGEPTAGVARTRAALDRCGGDNLYPGFRATIHRVLVAAQLISGDARGGLDTCERALALGGTTLWIGAIHRARSAFRHSLASPTPS